MKAAVLKKLETWLLLAMLAILSACAQGETLGNSPTAISLLPDDKARVFIYRKGHLVGSGIQPVVKINGVKTKDCQPKGVFIAELTAGQHRFSVDTEVESSLELDLQAGETRYIECIRGFGVIIGRVHLHEVDATEGEKATNRLVYTGTYRD